MSLGVREVPLRLARGWGVEGAGLSAGRSWTAMEPSQRPQWLFRVAPRCHPGRASITLRLDQSWTQGALGKGVGPGCVDSFSGQPSQQRWAGEPLYWKKESAKPQT